MNREVRYVIYKHSDIEVAGISDAERAAMRSVSRKIAAARELHGKPPLLAVVIESDWPEYEPVWAMLESRIDGTTPSQKEGGKS